jgi:hypothetical protein
MTKIEIKLKFLERVQEANMKIPSEGIGEIIKSLERRCWNRPKKTIPSHFFGIFGIFRGGKVVPDSLRHTTLV